MTARAPHIVANFLQSAVRILEGCIVLAHDTETPHHTIVGALQGANLLIRDAIEGGASHQDGDILPAPSTERLLQASYLLEVCIIGIRDIESPVKMLVAFARIQGALTLLAELLPAQCRYFIRREPLVALAAAARHGAKLCGASFGSNA